MLGKSFTYTYDKGGNIVSKSEYAYTAGTLGAATDTVSYTYDSTWKDKLTSYDGTSITYNEIGNPLTYGGDISYLWDGRELIRYQDANSDNVIHMSYNADGLRTLKNVIDFGSFPWTMDYYSYTWSAGGTLLGYSIKTYPSGRIADVRIIYGENGDAIGFTVKDYEGVEPQTYTYYYIKNAQGDVLRVVDETGATMADYTYDAWGSFTFTPGANAGANAGIIKKYNPVTYRGYYYDTDLEMYYLKSRYYNPRWGRFLSADDTAYLGTSGTILSYNLFAYSENNPINYIDKDGYVLTPINVIGAVIGAFGGVVIGVALSNYFHLTGWRKWAVTTSTTMLLGAVGWFAGPLIYNAIRPLVMKAITTGTVFFNQAQERILRAIGLSQTWINQALRLIDEETVKFSQTVLNHLNGDRPVPIQTLIDCIKSGQAVSDPQGMANRMMYYCKVWVNGKPYQMEVLVNWATRTIEHYLYN